MRRGAATTAVLLVSAATACAQEGDALTRVSPWTLLAQALLSLAVVVAIIYLAYFGLRRLSDRRLGAGEDGPLRLLQAKHLGGDRWLYLVRVGRRMLVVGGAAGQVTPIADLGETDLEGDAPDGEPD